MTKRLTRDALLTAIALTIFIVETQIPVIVPVPGIKLGLANIVTVYAMFAVGPKDTLGILLARVLLGGIFAGQLMTLMFSLCGGLLCYAVMLLLRRVLTKKQIWVCGAVGAVVHNIGQILAAIVVYGTVSVIVYLPVLVLSGIVTGTFTGLCAQLLTGRLEGKR
ncbi:MAG: Gx transporter family protein [Oscillospiraceae bacterium]|nr:Gx transporter family protein [Oscillospiraceae bacterium]